MDVFVLPKWCMNLVKVLGGTKWESLLSDCSSNIQDGQGQSLLICLSCCFCHHCSDTCQIKLQQQAVRDEWYTGSKILGAGSPLLKDFQAVCIMLWESQTWHKTTVGSQCSGVLCSLCCHWRTNPIWKLHMTDGRKELTISVHVGLTRQPVVAWDATTLFGIPTWWSISEFIMWSEKSDLKAPSSIWPASSIWQ